MTFCSLEEGMASKHEIPDAISFVNVPMSNMDLLLGVSDLRYQKFEDQIRKHPEWDTIVMTDRCRRPPQPMRACRAPAHEKVFVGSQAESSKPRVWFEESFHAMGGRESRADASPRYRIADSALRRCDSSKDRSYSD